MTPSQAEFVARLWTLATLSRRQAFLDRLHNSVETRGSNPALWANWRKDHKRMTLWTRRDAPTGPISSTLRHAVASFPHPTPSLPPVVAGDHFLPRDTNPGHRHKSWPDNRKAVHRVQENAASPSSM